MADTELGTVVRHIRDLVASRATHEQTDRQLLEAFLASRDERAFAEVVTRHGPLVLAVCRRVLGHQQDAEDAFQAAFLVLARNAGSIRKHESLGSWLHGVAYRIAMKAKRDAARRRLREREVKAMPHRSPPDLAWPEVQLILDQEIQRLPVKYRAVFVLCCLEGKNRAEVARELDLKEGTVRSRLSQARKQLQQRLCRRGIALTAVLGAAALSKGATLAAVPGALAISTVRAALLFVSGEAPVAGLVSAQVTTLARAATRAMFASKLKTAAICLLAAGLVAAAAGALAQRRPAPQSALPAPTTSAPSRDKQV